MPQPFPAAWQRSAGATGAATAADARRPHRRRRLPSTPRRARAGRSAPTEATAWACRSIPGAQFIASYDAGRGQRFYLFGSTASFVDS